MTTRPYRLEAFWAHRPDSSRVVAEQLASFFAPSSSRLLGAGAWHLMDSDALVRLSDADLVAKLEAALDRSLNSWSYGQQRFSANSLRLTNALPRPDSVQFAIKCRTTPDSQQGIWFANRIVLDVWAPSAVFPTVARLLDALDSACETFDATWASLGPPNWPPWRDLTEQLTGVPKVSWATYLSNDYAVPEALRTARQVRVGGANGGHRLLLTEEWFSAEDPLHLELVHAARRELFALGLLGPRTTLP